MIFNLQTVNKELEGLKEISLPDPVPFIPQTLGWFIVFGILFLLMGWLIYRFFRRRKQNRYRRIALIKLKSVSEGLDRGKAYVKIREIPELVKWTALQCYGRKQVARLSGDEWLAFLDNSFKSSGFKNGPGRLLPELAYGAESKIKEVPGQDVDGLIRLIRRWIRRHRV
jgi:hypothetical protein